MESHAVCHDPWLFTILIFIVGVRMGIGKAAVYIIPVFPHDVGAVGRLVGLLGALVDFPAAVVCVYQITAIPQTTFFVLLLITGASFLWFHVVVMRMLQTAAPHLAQVFENKSEVSPGEKRPSARKSNAGNLRIRSFGKAPAGGWPTGRFG